MATGVAALRFRNESTTLARVARRRLARLNGARLSLLNRQIGSVVIDRDYESRAIRQFSGNIIRPADTYI